MPPSPQILRHNGGTAPHFHSTVSVQKLRRLSTLILVLRLASFCFALASAVFMATARSDSANWVDYDAFRFVVAANAIVAVYSFVEMWVSVWEILKGGTLLPEAVQVWFDFGHDQLEFWNRMILEVEGAPRIGCAPSITVPHRINGPDHGTCLPR